MRTNKNLSNSFSSKVWNELANIYSKLASLEESVMSNVNIAQLYEEARLRIVNSALGKALGMTADTSVIDASIGVASVANRGSLNWKPTTSTSKTIEAGYYGGGTLDSSSAYAAGRATRDPSKLVVQSTAGGATTFAATIGHYYAVCSSSVSYADASASISGATVIKQSTVLHSAQTSSRATHLVMAIIKATSATVTVRMSTSPISGIHYCDLGTD